MIKSDSVMNLLQALFTAQAEFPTVKKEADNPYFKSKYATLESCLETVTPTLRKHGLMVLQFPTSDGPAVGVCTFIAHPSSGEYLAESYALPLSDLKAQIGVAAITYARRVALLAALGIAAEDDDGETASGRGKVAPKTKKSAFTESTKGEAKKPPKAEIPATPKPSEEASATPQASSDALPTSAELSKFRQRFVAFRKELEDAGLKDRQKSLAFICSITGKAKPEEITVNQWEAFFSRVEAFKKVHGIESLVKKIEENK